jgi:cell wall-associated NlpC family hydrolase
VSVEILGTVKGWNKVKIGSKVGYVASKFVTSENITSTDKSIVKSTAKPTAKSSRSMNALDLDVSIENSVESKVVNYAKEFVGVNYVYGGNSPHGFDCSGFISYVYKNFGINLNRSAESMYSNGTKVSKSSLKAGDLLFFDASSRKASGAIDHAGIYLGGGRFIHASSSNGEVRIQKLSEYRGTYIGAKRVI